MKEGRRRKEGRKEDEGNIEGRKEDEVRKKGRKMKEGRRRKDLGPRYFTHCPHGSRSILPFLFFLSFICRLERKKLYKEGT
jgi:hypothetical protein